MKDKILNFIDQDKKLKNINDEINKTNIDIFRIKEQQLLYPYVKDYNDEVNIKILEERIKIKKEEQNQLIDERNYFIFKLFWNIIVPITVSTITTFLINLIFK